MDGHLLMILVSILHSIPPIVIKYAYGSTNPLTSQLLWFLSAVVWAFVFRYKLSLKKPVIWFSLVNLVSLLLYFFTLEVLGASVVAFIAKSETLFIVMFGILLFKERFNGFESVGFVVAVIGIILISYSEEKITFIYGILALFGCLVNAYGFAIVKKYSDIEPKEYVMARAFFALVVTAGITIFTNTFVMPAPETYWIFIFVPLLTAVIAQKMQYKAMMITNMGKAGLIKNISPILTLLMAYLFLKEVLSIRQILGGILIIIGISVVLISKKQKARLKVTQDIQDM